MTASGRKSSPQTRYRRWVVGGLICFALFSVVKVWQNVRVDQLNRENARLRSRLAALKDRNAVLLATVEELKREDRIVRIAKEQLGMVESTTKKSIQLTPE
jgi:cell division protein FtsL